MTVIQKYFLIYNGMSDTLQTILSIGAALLIFGIFGTMFVRVVMKAKPKKKITRKELYEKDIKRL